MISACHSRAIAAEPVSPQAPLLGAVIKTCVVAKTRHAPVARVASAWRRSRLGFGSLRRRSGRVSQTFLACAVGLALVGLLTWVVLYAPEHVVDARHLKLGPKDRLDAESAVRGSLLQLIGGAVLVAGLYFTARGFRLTRQGHITDRYAKAVEQLGHESADIRIGGIFALERIARDSEADRSTVIEILSAFIREHTRAGVRTPKREPVTADVQAALTVLGRRPGSESEDHRIDLYHSGLTEATLSDGDWRGVMFYYSNLTGASFAGARLDGAGLSFCRSDKITAFTRASARGAHFVNATYTHGWFLAADLTDADFYGCDLSGSDFGRRYAEEGVPPLPPAIMTNVRLTRARLDGTNLRGVDLSTVRGMQPEQLAAAITDENTIAPTTWGGGETDYA